jgi:hypothetical protein
MLCKILPCNCTNPHNDTKYGKGMRVHNYAPGNTTKGSTKAPKWRCATCKAEKAAEKGDVK